jgi:hypothetical protein
LEFALQLSLPFEHDRELIEGLCRLIGAPQEVSMSSPRNELVYTNEFVGNLTGKSELVPVRVNTMVRMATEEVSLASERYDRTNGAPEYIFGCGGALPVQPSVQAMGRHYIKW